MKFRFERPVLSSAKRAQNKHKKNWRAQAKLLDVLSNDIIRGGVEDTRLEAKDTKKSEAKAKNSLSEDRPSRGQGQECSRPRTKDTAASVFKKKRSSKSFSGNLQFIGVARIFDWGGLKHKSHAITSSKICLLALNQDFAKGEGLNQGVEPFQITVRVRV